VLASRCFSKGDSYHVKTVGVRAGCVSHDRDREVDPESRSDPASFPPPGCLKVNSCRISIKLGSDLGKAIASFLLYFTMMTGIQKMEGFLVNIYVQIE
jgi:hypothetical protein